MTVHIVQVSEDSWGLQHPLACRPALLDCPLHKVVSQEFAKGRPKLLDGRYVVTFQDGMLKYEGVCSSDAR